MTFTNKQVLDVMLQRQQETTIPFSVWHHFTKNEFFDGLKYPEGIETSLSGLEKYINDVNPDFVKLMTDGFFHYPFHGVKDLNNLTELKHLKELTNDDPWITGQVELINRQLKVINGKTAFYNVFSPLTYFKWALINWDSSKLNEADSKFAKLYARAPQIVVKTLESMSRGIQLLVKTIAKTGIEGIYYSTQTIQDPSLRNNKDFFVNVHRQVDIEISNVADQSFKVNILHICGFDGFQNNLSWFTDYPYKVVNYAVNAEKVSLKEGKELFPNRVILGGLDITKEGILYKESTDDVEKTVTKLVQDAGKDRLIIGADCTIQRDTPVDNIRAARNTVHQI